MGGTSHRIKCERDFFDEYARECFKGEFASPLVERVLAEVRVSGSSLKEKIVLDAGCGKALWGNAMYREGAIVVGVDIGRKVAQLAKEYNDKRIAIVCADVRHLPFKSEMFDIVFYGYILHHLNEQDIINSLREARRALKKGGACCSVDPNGKNLYIKLIHRYRKIGWVLCRHMISLNERALEPHLITKLFSEAGFRDPHITTLPVIPSAIEQNLRFFRRFNNFLEKTLPLFGGNVLAWCLQDGQ